MGTPDQTFRVRYEYEQDPQIRLQYAHGVWGGINPQGELELNFYTESDKIPVYSERVVAPDGNCGLEICPEDDPKVIVRYIQAKIIVNYHTAQAIMGWLEEKIDALEEEHSSLGAFDEPAQ